MQVHHSRNLQCQVLVSDALLETSKQTEQNLQEYDGGLNGRQLSASVYCVCIFVRHYYSSSRWPKDLYRIRCPRADEVYPRQDVLSG